MAHAEFDATYVYDAALKRVREIMAKNKAIMDEFNAEREKEIDRFRAYRCGFLWLQIKTRTRDDAEMAYLRSLGLFGFEFAPLLHCAKRQEDIARLAKAAMSGTGRVTLTGEDCCAIGIPANFVVQA